MWVKRFRGLAAVLGFTLSAALLGPAAALAQNAGKDSDDLLEQVRRSQAVAAQRLESKVRNALVDAEKLSAKDTPGALSLLNDALALLESDAVLKDSRRESLRRVLKDRIRV